MRHRMRLSALALALPLTLGTGCGGPAAEGAGSTGSAGSTTSSVGGGPSPGATSPAALCTALVTEWARQLYAADGSGGPSGSGGYGDYQSMGLSNGQYAILRDVLDAARAERRRQSAAAGRKLIDRQARKRCAERHRDGGPSGGPWT
ncbi:hypothetical protein [Streptomyces sp. NPDC005898]|uniref:hypothetical protein n=1 Tax=unclassified Streptomyces TaxID=2593676 RepID=UPI0033D50CCF